MAEKEDYHSFEGYVFLLNSDKIFDIKMVKIIRPCPGIPTVIYFGRTYNTVQIASQCWFLENLNVGAKINSNSGTDNQTDNGIIEKYCYDNNEANCDIYGGLYQWNEVMQYSTAEGAQGICPSGWHIPSEAEFQLLSGAEGGGSNALKAKGQGTGSGAGTNMSGFSALLSGGRLSNSGGFGNLGYLTNFWCSVDHDASQATSMGLSSNDGYVFFDNDSKLLEYVGYSVRCLKD